MMVRNPSLVIKGAAVGLDQLEGLKFSPHANYTYCGICGEVYQTDMDRDPVAYATDAFDNNVVLVRLYCTAKHRQWSKSHASTHTSTQHQQLAMSGRHVTPEAANKLAAFGIIPLSDAVFDEEVNAALFESSPIPFNDAQGG